MENTATASETPRHDTCLCRELGAHLTEIFGIRSEEAKAHLRNARVEMLKAVRSIIDERIEHISGTQHKGTKLTVE